MSQDRAGKQNRIKRSLHPNMIISLMTSFRRTKSDHTLPTFEPNDSLRLFSPQPIDINTLFLDHLALARLPGNKHARRCRR